MRPVAQADYTQPGMEPFETSKSQVQSLLREARCEAMMHGQTVAVDDLSSGLGEEVSPPHSALVVPLRLRGQVIGTMALHEMRRPRSWTAEEIALAETVAEQSAQTVENLRLMDETQRRAARERLVGEITDQMQRATDIEDLLRITADGLNRALGGSRAFVRMGVKNNER